MNVYLPKDRVTNNHQGYGFVEYRAEEDADYVSTRSSLALRFEEGQLVSTRSSSGLGV